jgi:hypothetical protein
VNLSLLAANPFQQFLRWFVGGDWGNELAGEPNMWRICETKFAERKGEARTSGRRGNPRAGDSCRVRAKRRRKRGRQLADLPAQLGQPQLKLVGQRKQSFHSLHGFPLFGERNNIAEIN